MAYTDKQKEKIKKQFLDEYKKQRTISSAISGLKVNRDTIYEWFKQDPEFKQRFDEEKIAVGESLESNAFRLIDEMMVENDYKRPLLLITMLNANLPGKYRQADTTSEESKQLMEDFRKMAAEKKKKVDRTKAVKEAEDIINDSNTE